MSARDIFIALIWQSAHFIKSIICAPIAPATWAIIRWIFVFLMDGLIFKSSFMAIASRSADIEINLHALPNVRDAVVSRWWRIDKSGLFSAFVVLKQQMNKSDYESRACWSANWMDGCLIIWSRVNLFSWSNSRWRIMAKQTVENYRRDFKDSLYHLSLLRHFADLYRNPGDHLRLLQTDFKIWLVIAERLRCWSFSTFSTANHKKQIGQWTRTRRDLCSSAMADRDYLFADTQARKKSDCILSGSDIKFIASARGKICSALPTRLSSFLFGIILYYVPKSGCDYRHSQTGWSPRSRRFNIWPSYCFSPPFHPDGLIAI